MLWRVDGDDLAGVLCVGSSHALGGAGSALKALA
jgi:hypothetical protein